MADLLNREATPNGFRILVPALCLAGLLAVWSASAPGGLGTADIGGFAAAALPIAFAAVAQTFPIRAGAQGLSAGGTLVLVNAIVGQAPIDGPWSCATWCLAGLGAALLVGAVNGALVGLLALPSTPVTLSTGAVAAAVALQWAGDGVVPPAESLRALVDGPALAGVPLLPVAALAAFAALGQAALRTRWGRALDSRAEGGPGIAARPEVRRAVFLAYIVSASGAGLGGIVLAAQAGAVDALFGAPALVQVLAAVALGGGVPGLGGGTPAGSLLGALVVAATGNVLLPLGVPDALAPALDGGWLLLGLALASGRAEGRPGPPPVPASPRWSLPLAAAVVLLPIVGWLRPEARDLLTLAAGLGLLAAAQAHLLRRFLFDLSAPGLVALSSLGVTAITQGQAAKLPAAVASLAMVAVGAGAVHAMLARRFGRGAITATLATGSAATAAAGFMLVSLPTGFTPPLLSTLASAPLLGVPAAAWLAALASAALSLLVRRNADPLVPAYVGSALASVLFGIVLASLSVTTRYGAVDVYTLPVLAAACLAMTASAAKARSAPLAPLGAASLVLLLDTALAFAGAGYAPRVAATAAVALASTLAGARPSRLSA